MLLFFIFSCENDQPDAISENEIEQTVSDQEFELELEEAYAYLDAERRILWKNRKKVKKPHYALISDGKLSPTNRTIHTHLKVSSAKDIDSSLNAWQKSGNPLFLNCHGGLVPAKKAFTKPIKDSLNAVLVNNNLFPYYLIYDAGILQMSKKEVKRMNRQLKRLARKRLFGKLLAKIKELFTRKQQKLRREKGLVEFTALDTVTNFGLLSDANFEESIDWSDPNLRFKEYEVEGALDDILSELDEEEFLMFATIPKDHITRTDRKNFKKLKLVEILNQIANRYQYNRDHTLVLTLIEEALIYGGLELFGFVDLGALITKHVRQIWDASKKNVSKAFTNTKYAGGTVLVNKLADRKGDVILMGSSTGAIYVCEIIKKMKEVKKKNPSAFMELNIRVILVVAACQFPLFEAAFSESDSLFKKGDVLVMSLSDQMELKGRSSVAIGSTLYYVSSVAEDSDEFHDLPILGMQRYFEERGKLEALPDSVKHAIDFAYDYLSYGTDSTKMIVSFQPHPTASYLEHDGTRHVNLVKQRPGQTTMALFSHHGYHFAGNSLVADGN